MDKRLIFPSNTDDRRDVYFVREDRNYLRKHGSGYHPEIQQYIEKAQPLKDIVQVLLTALGAYEYWGQNVNGDRFREGALKHDGSDFGYKTFETNANYFLHHVNKDPALAKGKVIKAVWNDKAKRVELIVGIDINLDPEGINMVDRGEDLTFSMGAKVPYDVCSICQNKAKTRAEYCNHLRYLMNQIDPTSGLLVGADNTIPRFFDISRVLIPADKTAYMWTKVAGAANPYKLLGSAQLAELPPGKLGDTDYLTQKVAEQRELYSQKLADAKKSASVKKNAAITKRIEVKVSPELDEKLNRSIPPAKLLLQESAPSLSKETIEKILSTRATLQQILSTYAALGIEPKHDEAAHLIVHFKPTKESLEQSALSTAHFHPGVGQELLPFVPHRSFSRPILLRRILEVAEKLESGKDAGLKKKAEAVSAVVRGDRPHKEEGVHPGYLAGLLAALYALFGPHATGVAKGVGRLISNHPLLFIPLGAGAIAGANTLFGSDRPTGFYSVDSNTMGLYNKNWQSRFVDMQARPVTVIKTGAAQADTELAKKVFYGVPGIFLGSKIHQNYHDLHPEKRPRPVSKAIADNPELVSIGLIGEHLSGRPISKRVAKVLESGKRIIKSASLRNIEFLEMVPEGDHELLSDLAILDAAERIRKKLVGG